MDPQVLSSLGIDTVEIYKNTYSHISKLGYRVSCSYKCIIISCWCYTNIESNMEA
jgi:hypothetical protein